MTCPALRPGGSMVINARRYVVLYAALAAPFFLNDFMNIYVSDYTTWIVLDYLFVKALPIAAIVWAVRSGVAKWREFGFKRLPILMFIYYGLGLSVIGTMMDQYGYDFFSLVLPSRSIGGIPAAPEGSALGWFDLHFGLFLVAVVEEMVFRGLAWTALRRAGLNAAWAVLASSVVFGLIHWSLGLAAVVSTGLIGAVFTVCVWRTGSILPLILAHFAVNYIYFGF